MTRFNAGDAVVRLRLDQDRSFQQVSKRAERSLDGVSKAARRVVAAGAAILAGAGGLGAIGMFVRQYADAQETLSKFAAVFKEEADGAARSAEQMANRIGRSALEIKGFLATLQDTFVPLGFARKEARALSEQMVELAFDLASFNNIAVADVLMDLQSAIVGNHETMRKYGVIITESTLNHRLLAEGIAGGTRTATESQKVMARLGTIVGSTSDAQGDATRTADSLANRFVALKSAAMGAAVAIGESLVTAMGESNFSGALATLTDKLRVFNDELERNSELRRNLAAERGRMIPTERTQSGVDPRNNFVARTGDNAIAEILGRLGFGAGESQRLMEQERVNRETAAAITELARERGRLRRNERIADELGIDTGPGRREANGQLVDFGARRIDALLSFIDAATGQGLTTGGVQSKLEEAANGIAERAVRIRDNGLAVLDDAFGRMRERGLADRRSEIADTLTRTQRDVLQARADAGDQEAQLELELLRNQERYIETRRALLPIIESQIATESQRLDAEQALQAALAARTKANRQARERSLAQRLADQAAPTASTVSSADFARRFQEQVFGQGRNANERIAGNTDKMVAEQRKTNTALAQLTAAMQLRGAQLAGDVFGGS